MKVIGIHVGILILMTMMISCKGENSDSIVKRERVSIPKFESDSAYNHIVKQIAFGKRYMNTPEHEQCKDWLVSKLEEQDFKVVEQSFSSKAYTGTMLNGTNVIGSINPKMKDRVLLCAHYDTRHIADKDTLDTDRPIDGADDGASGVAVLLEIARLLNEYPIHIGIDIIFFDAEDYGSDQKGQDYTWGLGSQYWAKHPHDNKYDAQYGILLDMVGAEGATFRKEGFSMQSAQVTVDQIWGLASRMGKQKYFVDERIGYVTDDHRFIIEKANIPMVDIINVQENGSFGDYHHKHDDNIDIISKATLGAVGQVVTAYIYNEANGDNEVDVKY